MTPETTLQASRSQLPNRLPKWDVGGSDFAIFAALLFTCMAVGAGAFGALAQWAWQLSSDGDRPLLLTLAETFGSQAGMLAAYLGFIRFSRKDKPEDDSTEPRPVAPNAILIGLKWLLISYPVMLAVNLISRWALTSFGYEQVVQEPVRMVMEGGSLLERSMMYFMIAIAAPFCEEFVFRGAIFRYLHHRLPLVLALALSGGLFALIHLNLFSFAPLFAMGVLLAIAYRESGSVVSAITFHAAYNSLTLLVIIFFPDLS